MPRNTLYNIRQVTILFESIASRLSATNEVVPSLAPFYLRCRAPLQYHLWLYMTLISWARPHARIPLSLTSNICPWQEVGDLFLKVWYSSHCYSGSSWNIGLVCSNGSWSCDLKPGFHCSSRNGIEKSFPRAGSSCLQILELGSRSPPWVSLEFVPWTRSGVPSVWAR